jgi:hypothetical protein
MAVEGLQDQAKDAQREARATEQSGEAATARGDIQGRSSPLTAAVTPRSRSRPRPGPSISALLVLVGHPTVAFDGLVLAI